MTSPIPYAHVPPAGPWDRDLSHLRTLAICHYVWGALTMVFATIFIFHVVLGVAMLSNSSTMFPTGGAAGGGRIAPPPPRFVGWVFVAMGSCAVLLGWSVGLLTIYSGRCIATRRSRIFSLVMAGVNCFSAPVGTTLGVFTFIVLLRPSVQTLYEAVPLGPIPRV